MDKKHSSLGILSFAISLVCGVAQVLYAGIGWKMVNGYGGEALGTLWPVMLLPFLVFVWSGNSAGVLLGALGLKQEERKQVFSKLGITLNLLVPLLFLMNVRAMLLSSL